jgi:iron complex outermembrane recepter protein
LRSGGTRLNGGVWYEDNDFNQARRFYGEPNLSGPTRSFLDFQRNPLLTQWEYNFNTKTVQWHLQDTWTVTDAFKVNMGFKSVNVENEATPVIVASTTVNQPSSIEAKESFLPQAGFTWALSDAHEIFGGYART